MRVVVLGGYGHFGSIVAQRLARDGSFDVVVAGRDERRARDCAGRIGATGLYLDAAATDFQGRLARAAPHLVVSAAGPFQGQDFRVAGACLEAGCHYIDLADGRDFVDGIVALDGAARRANRLVVSGASSVPALSGAVVDRYRHQFAELHEIDTAIVTSADLPGSATVRAVLGYCGKPFSRWRDGRWVGTHGWHGLRRRPFPNLGGARWIADCDVPDLALFPGRYAPVRAVRFGAGMEWRSATLGLWIAAILARGGLRIDAPRLEAIARRMAPRGSGRSAMSVRLSGRDRRGMAMEVHWELVARRGHGAQIPCMAAVALARKLCSGQLPVRGAMPCVGLLTLDEYLGELTSFDVSVHCEARCKSPQDLSL